MIFYPVLEPPFRFNRLARILDRFYAIFFGAMLLSKADEGKSKLQFNL